MSNSPCVQSKIEQISTGQAGPEINRDFEQIFGAVNKLIRCMNKVVANLNTSSAGSFDSGSSESGGATSQAPTVDPPTHPPTTRMSMASGSNITLPDGGGFAAIEATADIEVTLGEPWEFEPWFIQNTATAFTITLKNNLGTTIGTLGFGHYAVIYPLQAAGSIQEWPTGFPVFAKDGIMYMGESVVFRDSAIGVVYRDTTDAHYILTQITADALVTTYGGASEWS